MRLPTTPVFALVLLLGTAAPAQPSPAREQRQRTVTITGNPADPPHEIRAAKGVSTVLIFKSRINGGTVEVDRTRVKIIEAGEWAIIFEPMIELGSDERLVLNVPFADGQRAVFVLVAHASEVDSRIDVLRREQTVEACQAELAESQARCAKISPIRFARDGWLTRQGVIALKINRCSGTTRMAGLVCQKGTAYRAETWALVDVVIINKSNDQPWVPSEAAIKSITSGVQVAVRAVEMDAAQLGPGERGHVFVEVDPPTSAREQFTLELRDAAGIGITIPEVDLSQQESKQ